MREVHPLPERLKANPATGFRKSILSAMVPNAEMRESLVSVTCSHPPISWVHVKVLGECDLAGEKLRDALGLLPPETGGLKPPRFQG